jgi:hypothetical protein
LAASAGAGGGLLAVLIRWSLRAVSGSRPSVGKVVAVLIVLPMNSMSCSLAAAAAFSLASVMLVFFSHSALLEATTTCAARRRPGRRRPWRTGGLVGLLRASALLGGVLLDLDLLGDGLGVAPFLASPGG